MSGPGSDAFQRALDEAGRKNLAANEARAGPTGAPRVRSVAFGAAAGSGGQARFGLALDWTDEPADPPPPQPPPRQRPERSGDPSAEIAAELGLGAPLTRDQLASRWRDFVWRNHPDRQPPDAREWADARMAIANTLYDRARRELAEAQRHPPPGRAAK